MNTHRFTSVTVFVAVVLAILSTSMVNAAPMGNTPGTTARISASYSKLPLYFIENTGQLNAKVKYYETRSGHAMFFVEDGIYLILIGGENISSSMVKLSALNANPKHIQGFSEARITGFTYSRFPLDG